MASELKAFYKKKAKSTKPGEYDYDDAGNLIIRENGTVIKTIPLPNYRAPTLEEIGVMEQRRTEAIAKANQAFDQALKDLHTAIERKDTKAEILRYNRRVAEADQTLQHIRFPLRGVSVEDGLLIRDIDFSKQSETRKYSHNVYIQNIRPFTLQETYVRAGENIKQPLISLAEIKEAEKTPVILFAGADTPIYGFLSLNWPVQLADATFSNPSGFHSARQAIAYKMANAMGDDENRNAIAQINNANAIDYVVEDVPGDADKDKWKESLIRIVEEVTRMKFTQHPELGEQLRSTQNAILGADEPADLLLGIGWSMLDQQSKIPKRWTGENILGKALMKIRQELLAAAPKKSSVVRRPAPNPTKVSAATSASKASAAPAAPAPAAPAAPVPVPAPVPAAPAPVPVATKPKTAADLLAAARAARAAKTAATQ